MFVACADVAIKETTCWWNHQFWGMYPRVHQDNILGWFWSNEDFLLPPIDAIIQVFSSYRYVWCTWCWLVIVLFFVYHIYIYVATQQFQAWTPNGSNPDSRRDLPSMLFASCLTSESSKYINFLSYWLNLHELSSGDDANIRSCWFSNSSLKNISSNSVYIFLRISPHLWKRTDDRQWNWCEQYVVCWRVRPSLTAGSLWFLDGYKLHSHHFCFLMRCCSQTLAFEV